MYLIVSLHILPFSGIVYVKQNSALENILFLISLKRKINIILLDILPFQPFCSRLLLYTFCLNHLPESSGNQCEWNRKLTCQLQLIFQETM